MSQPIVKIEYKGGIENKELGTNLTGSSTLMKIKDESGSYISIAIDYGMHQGGNKQDEMNKKIDKDILKADYLIITHAHMDHVGRLPMLVKNGFKGKILMTNLTKQIALVMLSNYVKLTEKQIKETKKYNERIGKKFRNYLQAIKLYDELTKGGIKKNDKIKKQKKLSKIIGIEINNGEIQTKEIKTKINEIKKDLRKNHIEKESDIKLIQKEEPVLLYTLDDVYKTISLIKTIKIGDELDLDNRIFITDVNDERIFDLPKLIKNGYNKKIYVLPHIKQAVIQKLEDKLNNIKKHNTENKDLRIQLKQILKKGNKTKEDIDLLNKYGIENEKDIENLKEKIIKFPYTYDDIENIKNHLEIINENDIKKIIESIKLNFHNAGHIEGSVQATISIVTIKIINLLDNKGKQTNFKGEKEKIREYKNFGFSGDLGKFTDSNISGKPDIPPYKYDFFQCESTYADREHPYKKEEFNKFLKEINETKGKVLIPAFSLQRTQEILLELIENKISKQELIEKYWNLRKELKQQKQNIYEKLNIKSMIQIKELEQQIKEIEEQVFLYDIMVDSPLSKQVTDIFLQNLGEKYKLLDEGIQKEKLGKQLITYLESGEYKKLYKEKRKKKKDIIISAGGMLQGGSIINHLKEIISDPNSKIIFTGYQAEGTLGRKLLDGEKQVIIDGEIYNVRCKIVQIRGYSSHIGKKDLITYLTEYLQFSKNGIIALNHGGEARKHLMYEVNKLKPNQKIKIPQIGDTIEIKL